MEEREFLKQVGARIRDARQRAGLSQSELALKVGKLQDAISRYEQGRRALKLNELLQIAKVLDVSIGDLIVENDVDIPPSNALATVAEAAVKETLLQLFFGKTETREPDVLLKVIDGKQYLIVLRPGLPVVIVSKDEMEHLVRSRNNLIHHPPTEYNQTENDTVQLYIALIEALLKYALEENFEAHRQNLFR
jgi:transcriptional regulator with XRE-family HTH domain